MLEMRDAMEYAGEYALDAQGKRLELIWFKYREDADRPIDQCVAKKQLASEHENLNDEVANEEQT